MTNEIRDDLKYTDSHEWIKVKDDIAIIGITDHAQSELTDIVFAELPVIGKELKKGDELCVVESVKSVSEIYSPISGKIINVNNKLEDNPEIINERELMHYYKLNGTIGKIKLKYKLLRSWILQFFASLLPSSELAVIFHRARGVNIGKHVFIGPNVYIDLIYPHNITIEDYVSIGMNTMIALYI